MYLLSVGRLPTYDLWNWNVPGGGRRNVTSSHPRFRFSQTFCYINFRNDFRIGFSLLFDHLLDGFTPNVPSFFATYVLKIFLQMLIFVCFPSFSANPRRHEFYCGVRMILVHAPFSKTMVFMRSNSESYRKSGLFSHYSYSIFMTCSARPYQY